MNLLNMGYGHLDMAGMIYANVITTKHQEQLLAIFYTNWRHDMEWMDQALCREVDYELFFPDSGGSSVTARKVCGRCEVKVQCLAYALTFPSMVGIWGGTTEKQRRLMKRRHDA